MNKINIYHFIMLISLILLNGCFAAYPDRMPNAHTYNQVEQGMDTILPGIDYECEIKELTGTGQIYPDINKNKLMKRISHVFSESHLFSNIEMGDGVYPLHADLQLEFRAHQLDGLTLIPAVFTAFIIPAYAREDFFLYAKVYHNYNMVKRYEYSQKVSVFLGLLFIARSSEHSYENAHTNIIDQMLLDFLYDFKEDFIVSGKITQ